MTDEELRELCRSEVLACLRKLAEIANDPRASITVRCNASALLRAELERLSAAGNS